MDSSILVFSKVSNSVLLSFVVEMNLNEKDIVEGINIKPLGKDSL